MKDKTSRAMADTTMKKGKSTESEIQEYHVWSWSHPTHLCTTHNWLIRNCSHKPVLFPRSLHHWNVISQGTSDAQDALEVIQVVHLALRAVSVTAGKDTKLLRAKTKVRGYSCTGKRHVPPLWICKCWPTLTISSVPSQLSCHPS